MSPPTPSTALTCLRDHNHSRKNKVKFPHPPSSPRACFVHTCSWKATPGSEPRGFPFQFNCDVAMETANEVFLWPRPRLGTRGPHCRHPHRLASREPCATPLPAQGSPELLGGSHNPQGCVHLHTRLFSLQPSPSQHTKGTFLGGRNVKEKMYFFPAFQLPELSEGMNGLGKISHRNKFTRDS